ncbi:MAG: superoxide dismutase [Nitrospirota bacterium]
MHHHHTREFKLEGKLKGISDRQIQEHRDILYKGYVDKLNLIEKEISETPKEGANPTYAPIRELKKEECFTTNAVYLHELYFENLGGGGGQPTGKIGEVIKKKWGTNDKWMEDFKAAGLGARGWVVMAWSFNDNELHGYSMDMHDVGAIWNAVPLLVLDCYEHAYMIDYGVKRAPYLDAFFQNINWDVVNRRLETAMKLEAIISKAA